MSKEQEHGQLSPPVPNGTDTAHAAVRVALALVPGLGGAASELFQAVVTPPLEKRRDDWMRTVGETLQELLQRKSVTVEELQHDDAFIDTLLQASQVALRNSQKEKRDYLRCAIVNAALGESPSDSILKVFLHLVDVLTVWHVRVLKLVDDPRAWAAAGGIALPGLGGLRDLICDAYPELRGRRELCDLIWRDLYASSLVKTERLDTTMTGTGLASRRTTELGREFLTFIDVPQSWRAPPTT